RGYRLTLSRAWKRPNINLDSPGLVRLIRDPISVRRELSVSLFEGGPEKWKRLPIAVHRQYPQIETRSEIGTSIKNETTPRRPSRRHLVLCRCQNEFVTTEPVGRLFIKVIASCPAGVEYTAAAGRRPDPPAVTGRIRRESREQASHHIKQ